MFHWCGEETAMVAGFFSSVGLSWAWLNNRVRAWRVHREQRAMEKVRKRYGWEWGSATAEEIRDVINAPIGPSKETIRLTVKVTDKVPTDMEKVAALMKGGKL